MRAERLLGAAQRYHRINPELEFDIALDDVSPQSFAALRTKVRTPLPTDQPLVMLRASDHGRFDLGRF